MPDVLDQSRTEQSVSERFVRLRTTVIAVIVAAVVFGGGGYLVGHEVGVRAASGPSADFIRQQQADSVRQMQTTTNHLVQIEQNTIELMMGKSGAELDVDAIKDQHLQYVHTYDAILAERGRLSRLFDAPVLAAAKEVTHRNNVALDTLYFGLDDLSQKSVGQIGALLFNSHKARKGQWEALRRFQQAAWLEINSDR